MSVYLIGAGPGDPGLLTLRGKAALVAADVVVYDYLAAPELLEHARPDAERIYVGKKAGAHALSQDGINHLLVELARQGKCVARLKGGDPYIFGRGGEEALALCAAGIAFEEIPGVSSTIAGPAYAGIPLTHRTLSSSVTIITGHEDADKAASVHDWSALARSASTLVFVMGMKQLPEICANLIRAGLSPDMPSAIIHWATTPRHRSLTARLEDLPQAARQAGLSNPSIIVVGEVVRLREQLNWFEQRPLHGKSIVVTRAREQASDLAAGFESLGARVIRFPLIRVQPVADTGPLEAAIAHLGDYKWIVFSSVNAVACFWDGLAAAGRDSRALAQCKLAAIGPSTAAALAQRGIRVDLMPDVYRAEALSEALVASGVRGTRILLPCARLARDVLCTTLEKAGACVDLLAVYDTLPVTDGADELLAELAGGKIQCITFGSSSTVDNFFAAIAPEKLRAAQAEHELRFACIGPITATTLATYGFACDIQPASFTIAALIDAVHSVYTGIGKNSAVAHSVTDHNVTDHSAAEAQENP